MDLNFEYIERNAKRIIDAEDLGLTLLGPYHPVSPQDGKPNAALLHWVLYEPYSRTPLFGGLSKAVPPKDADVFVVDCIVEDARRLAGNVRRGE